MVGNPNPPAAPSQSQKKAGALYADTEQHNEQHNEQHPRRSMLAEHAPDHHLDREQTSAFELRKRLLGLIANPGRRVIEQRLDV